jgi:hypothetical protein
MEEMPSTTQIRKACVVPSRGETNRAEHLIQFAARVAGCAGPFCQMVEWEEDFVFTLLESYIERPF